MVVSLGTYSNDQTFSVIFCTACMVPTSTQLMALVGFICFCFLLLTILLTLTALNNTFLFLLMYFFQGFAVAFNIFQHMTNHIAFFAYLCYLSMRIFVHQTFEIFLHVYRLLLIETRDLVVFTLVNLG